MARSVVTGTHTLPNAIGSVVGSRLRMPYNNIIYIIYCAHTLLVYRAAYNFDSVLVTHARRRYILPPFYCTIACGF